MVVPDAAREYELLYTTVERWYLLAAGELTEEESGFILWVL